MLVLDDFRDLTTAIARCRRLLDLDADPEAVVDALSADRGSAPVVAKAPGQRIPRTVDEAELARARGAGPAGVDQGRAHPRRPHLVAAYGQPMTDDPAAG